MIGSHYSVRFVQTRKEEPRITFEEFLDVKWACHHWLMENSPEYRREQQELPERRKMRKRDECCNCLTMSGEEED